MQTAIDPYPDTDPHVQPDPFFGPFVGNQGSMFKPEA